MTKLIAFVFTLFLTQTVVFAQNTNYTAAMEEAVAQIHQVESLEEVAAIANKFERITKVASEEWLPKYYLVYSQIMLAWQDLQNGKNKDADQHVRVATNTLAAAKHLAGENSELYVLEAYIYQVRIMRSPMMNGPRFSGSVDEALAKARKLDENNPRAYYLQGQQWLNMPSFMGGGKEKAVPQFEMAAQKFESYQPASELHPNWGKGQNQAAIDKLTK
ncbi:MAG: hypothetical protein AAF849_03155 [Bacteroidota bacterium]